MFMKRIIHAFFVLLTDTDRIWDNPFAGMLRLMEGNYPSEGRVEVYCNEQWGTVCNDGFGENEADTVCRQLGYDTALSFDSLSLERLINFLLI